MGLKGEMQKIGNHGLAILWYLVHFFVSTWYFLLNIVQNMESFLISRGLLKGYDAFNVHKLRYLAIAVESEEARETSKIIELLQWLESMGVNHLCLYDAKGVLKNSKETILKNLKYATLLEEADDDDSPHGEKQLRLEFTSFSDGKEAVVKAANLLLFEHMKRDLSEKHEEIFFTEPHMTEALRAVGCRGPEPDLLLVYGPVRCHLGFPAWRIRYTEIVHMGRLQSMRYGSLIKAIYKFTKVRQNYGK